MRPPSKVAPTRRTKRRAPPPAGPEVAARLARRERRRNHSRGEILDAARRVLLRKGIAATTLEAVASEAGLSKTALYYYFPSKDALFFELVFGSMQSHAMAVHDAVEHAGDGADALRAIIRETVAAYAARLDDFRLAFLHGQVAGEGAVHFDQPQFARIRPLNDLWFAGAAKQLGEERRKGPDRAGVEPRLMAFLAFLSAIGFLTMKGMVESLEDPLAYTDDQVVDGLARVFAVASAR
jgi:AcrR family transcriptional regulator